jgi:hypothetical protein
VSTEKNPCPVCLFDSCSIFYHLLLDKYPMAMQIAAASKSCGVAHPPPPSLPRHIRTHHRTCTSPLPVYDLCPAKSKLILYSQYILMLRRVGGITSSTATRCSRLRSSRSAASLLQQAHWIMPTVPAATRRTAVFCTTAGIHAPHAGALLFHQCWHIHGQTCVGTPS